MRRTVVVLAALTMLAAACGDDAGSGVASLESSTTTAPPSTVPTDEATEQALFEFAECMRGEGIDIPDPVIGPDGFPELSRPIDFEEMDLDAAAEALRTCQGFLDGVSLGFDLEDQTAFLDLLVEFAVCMREQGIDLSDPDVSGGLGPGVFPNIDFEDPDVLAAVEVCGELLRPE